MQQAAASNGQTAGLEDYDPFNKQKTTSSVPAAGGQPAVMSPTQEAAPAPPPQYTQTAQQQATAADFQVRKGNWLTKSLSCTNVKYCFDIPRLQELQVVQNKQYPWRTLVHSGRLLHSYYRFSLLSTDKTPSFELDNDFYLPCRGGRRSWRRKPLSLPGGRRS